MKRNSCTKLDSRKCQDIHMILFIRGPKNNGWLILLRVLLKLVPHYRRKTFDMARSITSSPRPFMTALSAHKLKPIA